MPSALNRTGFNIYKGRAVTVSGDLAAHTTPPAVCSALVLSGAASPGVINLINSGVIELLDWTLVTTQPTLIVGAVYTVRSTGDGMLEPNGTGQAVGQAISSTKLSVHIDVGQSQTSFTTVSAPTTTPPQFIVSSFPPYDAAGNIGDYFIYKNLGQLFGPKTADNKWPPTPILYS